jgi:uncharacterized LabA/DUF88 family protein
MTQNSLSADSTAASCRRIAVYVDGFNLYFGLKDAGWKRHYWLDIWQLAENLVRGGRLCLVKYFTAHVKGNPPKQQRQQVFLQALAAHRPRLQIICGHYLLKQWQCRKCGNISQMAEEKKTDVNIATNLLGDAYEDLFDAAIVVSADSDLVPPIEMIRSLWPEKRVVVGFPPKRASKELRKVAHNTFYINEAAIRVSHLPNPVVKADGGQLSKPVGWQ